MEMKHKVQVLIFGLLVMSANHLVAQTAEESVTMLRDSVMVETDSHEAGIIKKNSGLRVGMNVGTSYAFASGYGSGMRFYAAPTLTMPVTGRLSLHAGVLASSFYPVSGKLVPETGMPAMLSSLSLFAAASYQLNDRLTLHGAGVKQLVNAPVNYPLMPYPVDNLSLGATFRLGDNVTIGASVSVRSNNGYNYIPPFSYPVSPFVSPFSSYPYGW